MDGIGELLAIEEIKRLKARYFRCMDTKDFDGLALLFAPDATLTARTPPRDLTDGAALTPFTVSGRAAIMDAIVARTKTAMVMHHGHMPEIDILDADTARGIFAMESRHWVMKDARATAVVRSFGYYRDTFVRRDGQWRIASCDLHLLRADTEVLAP